MTPLSLVYGEEVVLPLKIEIPSLQVSTQDLIYYEGLKSSQISQLEELDEKRLLTYQHLEAYKN